MGFGKLLDKVRDGRKKLEDLKAEVATRQGSSSKENKSKAGKILSGIDKVLKKADKIEKEKVSVGDLVNLGGNLIKDQIKNEKVKDIIDKTQEVLHDGKVDVKEILDKGLEVVQDHVKDGKIKDIATAAREILENGKTSVGEIFGVAADVFKKEIEKAGLTDIVRYTKDFLEGVNSLEDLLEKGKKELERLAKEAAKKLLDKFINGFLNKGIKKELIKIKHHPPRSKWGRLSMGMSLDVSMTGELSGNFTGQAVIINTRLTSTSWAEGDLKLDVSFTIPVIKKEVKGFVTAAVKGNLFCDANAALELTVKDLTLTGDLKPTTIVTDYDMTLCITIPDWIVDMWNGAASWSFGYLDAIDGEFSHKIGKHKLFKIEVPGYKTSFDMKSLSFSGGVNGNFKVVAGEDTEVIIQKIEKYLPWK